jgi:hypothetical protein
MSRNKRSRDVAKPEAHHVFVTADQRRALSNLVNDPSTPTPVLKRAIAVLALADGTSQAQVHEDLKVSPNWVTNLCNRWTSFQGEATEGKSVPELLSDYVSAWEPRLPANMRIDFCNLQGRDDSVSLTAQFYNYHVLNQRGRDDREVWYGVGPRDGECLVRFEETRHILMPVTITTKDDWLPRELTLGQIAKWLDANGDVIPSRLEGKGLGESNIDGDRLDRNWESSSRIDVHELHRISQYSKVISKAFQLPVVTRNDLQRETLKSLKGSEVSQELVKFLAKQPDYEATLRETARRLKTGGREPTRRDLRSTQQRVRRAAKKLELISAPLRIEYSWLADRISLVDQNGNRPRLSEGNDADEAK